DRGRHRPTRPRHRGLGGGGSGDVSGQRPRSPGRVDRLDAKALALLLVRRNPDPPRRARLPPQPHAGGNQPGVRGRRRLRLQSSGCRSLTRIPSIITSVGPLGPAGAPFFFDIASRATPAARAASAAIAVLPPPPVKGRVVAVVEVGVVVT